MKFNGILFSICSVFVFDHIPAKIIDISISLSCSLTNISILACWDEMSAVLFSLEQVADNILWIIKKMFVTFTCSCNLIAIKLNIAACIAMFWKKKRKIVAFFLLPQSHKTWLLSMQRSWSGKCLQTPPIKTVKRVIWWVQWTIPFSAPD